MADKNPAIEALLSENRRFKPDKNFTENANIKDAEIYERANADPEKFWSEMAEELDWFKKWDTVLDWNPPDSKWFLGGKINVSFNCIDRHLKGTRRNKAAIIWEGEPGDWKVYTYKDNIISIVDDLKKEKYNIVIDFHNNIRSFWVRLNLNITSILLFTQLPAS